MKKAGEAAKWAILVLSTAIVLLIIAYLSTVHAEERFGSYSCEDARRVIAEVGKVRAMALAIESGLSLREIWKIRRACKL